MTGVMEKFFSPKSVCVIGASSTPGKPGNVVVRNMKDAGYKGKVFLVNPRGGKIEGFKVFPSIADLPDNIDQAVVTLPAAGTPDTVRALGKKGVEAIILYNLEILAGDDYLWVYLADVPRRRLYQAEGQTYEFAESGYSMLLGMTQYILAEYQRHRAP